MECIGDPISSKRLHSDFHPPWEWNNQTHRARRWSTFGRLWSMLPALDKDRFTWEIAQHIQAVGLPMKHITTYPKLTDALSAGLVLQ
jgi:hypothetical protein